MVNNSSAKLDAVFKALSDPTRRGMLAELAKGDRSVTELAEPYAMSLAAVSKHLKVLAEADFVEKFKEGRNFRCRAKLEPLDEVYKVLDELGSFWRAQLSSLETYFLNKEKKKEKKRGSKKN